jgi:ATP-dependent 26S proteasome regulatory subunit
MLPGYEAVQSLRAALAVSPDNVPLRKHLAVTLLNLGQFDEAEREFREALRLSPGDADLKVSLASAYYQNDKTSEALVIAEDLVKRGEAPAAAYVLYARLLLREGQIADAVAQYKLAIELDPEARDEELSQRLGVVPEEEAGEFFEGRVRQSKFDGPAEADVDVERPRICFRDVGGMDALKEEIGMKIIYPLQHPEMFQAYGKQVGGGILLYGPPGCGKTHLARATAGEIEASFLSVGISEVLDMWIGVSERNLRALFDQARTHRPCVLFFDEVDALGARRSDMRQSSGRQLINQFLSEMDGVERSNEGLLVLAATNAPWHVDPAFRRPGRFDRVLFVPPPDGPARVSILKILCAGKPTENIDFDHVSGKTKEFSGADLKAVVDMAVENKLREAIKLGAPKPLVTKDLLSAARQVKPTTREWFATARNYALYSNQDGAYDDVLDYLKLK